MRTDQQPTALAFGLSSLEPHRQSGPREQFRVVVVLPAIRKLHSAQLGTIGFGALAHVESVVSDPPVSHSSP